MDNKIEEANAYVRQTAAYHEKCGESPNMDEIINDAANIFGDTYEEYCAIFSELMK